MQFHYSAIPIWNKLASLFLPDSQQKFYIGQKCLSGIFLNFHVNRFLKSNLARNFNDSGIDCTNTGSCRDKGEKRP